MRRALTVVFLALPMLAVAPLSSAASRPVSPLGHEGTWITDARGRVVITHGVNLVYKRPPFQPAAVGFGVDDARFLARHGFTSVRLGVLYEAVEPQPGEYDDHYLERIQRIQHLLARFGIYTLLDFHQDLFNEKFGGEGFPSWAVVDDGLPVEPAPGFSTTYFTSPAENQAWNSLWANRAGPGGVGLQDRYAAAWQHVAARFRGEDMVLGYDLINEPWPGSRWPTCAQAAGCPDFERNYLAPMQDRAIAAIRRVDDTHTVWYEPAVTTQGGPTYWMPGPDDANVGMSFHVYCSITPDAIGIVARILLVEPDCQTGEQRAIDNARARAAANADPLLMSEFGATDDPAVITRMVDRADNGMVSWQWWHYCGCDDPTTSGPGDTQAIVSDPARPPRGDNVFRDKLALIERPYPQALNGTPTSYSFDRGTTTFRLAFSRSTPSGKRLSASLSSEVYVPRIHYRDGYRVKATGVRVVSDPGARVMLLDWEPGASKGTVEVLPTR